jgi:hypothetical protein
MRARQKAISYQSRNIISTTGPLFMSIQNAADLEFPATDPAPAPARAEFKLGIFPPDHHVAPAAPTPTPATLKP